MIRRISTLAVLFWTLFLVPGLCAGGALVHPCECGPTSTCGHEERCSLDPCGDETPIPQGGKIFAFSLEPLSTPLEVCKDLGDSLSLVCIPVPDSWDSLHPRVNSPLLL